jgi:hypothetical protein
MLLPFEISDSPLDRLADLIRVDIVALRTDLAERQEDESREQDRDK